MTARRAITIVVSKRQQNILNKLARGTHTPQHYIERANIILLAAQDVNNCEIARRLGLCLDTIKRWRKRWFTFESELGQVEIHRPYALKEKMKAALSDEQRLADQQHLPPRRSPIL